MPIQGAASPAAAGPVPSPPGSSPAARPAQQMDYMKLIVAQMRNLNPMDPSSGGDSLPTMMQAEALNQLTLLNGALKELQTMTQTGYATTLIGRTVSGMDAGGAAVSGAVRAVRMEAGGPALELADGRRMRLADVRALQAEA